MIDAHINTLTAGADASPYHHHSDSENAYFVLDGRVIVCIDGSESELEPGDLAFVPPGVPHSIGNVGPKDARVLELYGPPNADFVLEVTDNPCKGARGSGHVKNADLE